MPQFDNAQEEFIFLQLAIEKITAKFSEAKKRVSVPQQTYRKELLDYMLKKNLSCIPIDDDLAKEFGYNLTGKPLYLRLDKTTKMDDITNQVITDIITALSGQELKNYILNSYHQLVSKNINLYEFVADYVLAEIKKKCQKTSNSIKVIDKKKRNTIVLSQFDEEEKIREITEKALKFQELKDWSKNVRQKEHTKKKPHELRLQTLTPEIQKHLHETSIKACQPVTINVGQQKEERFLRHKTGVNPKSVCFTEMKSIARDTVHQYIDNVINEHKDLQNLSLDRLDDVSVLDKILERCFETAQAKHKLSQQMIDNVTKYSIKQGKPYDYIALDKSTRPKKWDNIGTDQSVDINYSKTNIEQSTIAHHPIPRPYHQYHTNVPQQQRHGNTEQTKIQSVSKRKAPDITVSHKNNNNNISHKSTQQNFSGENLERKRQKTHQ